VSEPKFTKDQSVEILLYSPFMKTHVWRKGYTVEGIVTAGVEAGCGYRVSVRGPANTLYCSCDPDFIRASHQEKELAR
jgi:hypothetical protein